MVQINELNDIPPMRKLGEKRLRSYRIEFHENNDPAAKGPTMVLLDRNADVQVTLWNSLMMGDQNGYIFLIDQPMKPGQNLRTFVFNTETDEYNVNDIEPPSVGDAAVLKMGFIGKYGEPAIELHGNIMSLLYND